VGTHLGVILMALSTPSEAEVLKALRDTSASGMIVSFQIVPYPETSSNSQIFPG